MSITRFWFLNSIPYPQESGLSGELTEAGKVQDETGTSFCFRKQENLQNLRGPVKSPIGTSLKVFPLAKYGAICVAK